MNRKYQVFISSTFKDLVEERQETIRSVLDLGHIPSGMEIFPAADIEQFEYIKKVVDEGAERRRSLSQFSFTPRSASHLVVSPSWGSGDGANAETSIYIAGL